MGGRGVATKTRAGVSKRTEQRRRARERDAALAGGGGGEATGGAESDRKAQLRNFRNRTPEETFGAVFDKLANKDYGDYNISGLDNRTVGENAFKALGFDKKGQVVSLAELRRDVQSGMPRMLRSVAADNPKKAQEFADQFISGKARASQGIHGTSLAYTASGKEARALIETFVHNRVYGSSAVADIRMTMQKGSRIIKQDRLLKMMEADKRKENNRIVRLGLGPAVTRARAISNKVYNDAGLYAAMRGFDAIRVPARVVRTTYNRAPNTDEIVVLNRGAVRVARDVRVRGEGKRGGTKVIKLKALAEYRPKYLK